MSNVYLITPYDGKIFLGNASDKYAAAKIINEKYGNYNGCAKWSYYVDENGSHIGECYSSSGSRKSKKSKKSKKSRKSKKSKKSRKSRTMRRY